MSLTVVRGYFRTRMNALGFDEHTDAFNIENIPSTKINKAYHILSGDVSQLSQGHGCMEASFPTTISFFLKGFRNPAAAVDASITNEQAIIEAIMLPDNWISGVKYVGLASSTREPAAISNDNIVLTTMTFNTTVVIATSA